MPQGGKRGQEADGEKMMDLKSLGDILGGDVQVVGTKLALRSQAWAGARVGAATVVQ